RLLEALPDLAVLHLALVVQSADGAGLGRPLHQAGDQGQGHDQDRADQRRMGLVHTAPLCGARVTKGTPKKVRKASTKTATIIAAPARGPRRQVRRACTAAESASQVMKAQVSSGSQSQKRP